MGGEGTHEREDADDRRDGPLLARDDEDPPGVCDVNTSQSDARHRSEGKGGRDAQKIWTMKATRPVRKGLCTLRPSASEHVERTARRRGHTPT